MLDELQALETEDCKLEYIE